ncbi:Panacea domain-containing protein [Candidatus Phytoplasma pruni]|uniref:DUF4065 domain-containing protein n=1 Tax=Candidatus Phytoplasma pruni TaxID=479893 RepID=A0A851HFW3_9MOLU|nr:type II toxin-antitoxin system antitoxin SocA domain-containing protein [Candidatus Phytoplasma pruni]NWN45520.1 DUF4065 domain-containing protein [Candidatus Phytoplasma pruni]
MPSTTPIATKHKSPRSGKKTNIFDIANYIIENNICPITKMKMNKMIYYAHAKSLVEYNEPLVTEEMQAWIYGPVFPTLTKVLKKFTYQPIPINTIKQGNSNKLTAQQKAILDTIIQKYGDKKASFLSHQTHDELPWLNAYDEHKPWSENVINDEDIKTYFHQHLTKIQ